MAGCKRSIRKTLDYHEGLSPNQVRIILREFGLESKSDDFNNWLNGQTCPVVIRFDRKSGEQSHIGGVYEYDLFRWIENQKKGTPLVWD